MSPGRVRAPVDLEGIGIVAAQGALVVAHGGRVALDVEQVPLPAGQLFDDVGRGAYRHRHLRLHERAQPHLRAAGGDGRHRGPAARARREVELPARIEAPLAGPHPQRAVARPPRVGLRAPPRRHPRGEEVHVAAVRHERGAHARAPGLPPFRSSPSAGGLPFSRRRPVAHARERRRNDNANQYYQCPPRSSRWLSARKARLTAECGGEASGERVARKRGLSAPYRPAAANVAPPGGRW